MPKKAVLLSIKPKYCELIANGKKTIEVRKTKPKLEPPFKCYIYCTISNNRLIKSDISTTIDYIAKNSGKVIGEFVCDEIFPMSITYSDPNHRLSQREFPFTCLTDKEIMDYLGNGKRGYGWHISELKIYETPKELGKFKKINRECWYADLGLAKRDCPDCKNAGCFVSRPPQSWCYVEEVQNNERL